MIQYSEAVEIVKNEFSGIKLRTEKVNILDSLNRVLAEDIIADTPQPIFTNSAMDGFAVKFKPGILKWKVTGEISAGKFRNFKPGAAKAIMIMTGSRMPESADTVIPIEHVNINGNEISLVNDIKIKKLQNVRKSGEDIAKGEKVITKGTLIKANQIQLASSCGKINIKVFKKIKTGVLTTGNELIDIEKKPKGDKIRASNLYSLLAGITESGFQPVNLGISIDDKSLLKRKIQRALSSGIDILLTSGGVSEGKYDFLPDIYNELGVKILFHKVNIKPGKPMLFGVYKRNRKKVLIFGLPGNPVSCYVNFTLFVRNIFYSSLTNADLYNLSAILNESIKKKDKKKHFARAFLKETGGVNYVTVSGSQSSANALGLSNANVLIEFPENTIELKKGSVVKCIKI